MNIIITGMNGTVAPFIARDLENLNYTIIPWDRSKVSTENKDEIENFIKDNKGDFVYHIGLGSSTWAKTMAEYCYKNNIGFLFTSTVDVLKEQNQGPYTVDSKPYATTDYGLYKIECENIIQKVNPNAYIVRLGWQIGVQPGSNNMIDYFYKQMDSQGYIEASKEYYPSCSFLWDTSKEIVRISHELEPGLYLLNSNKNYSFYKIAEKLLKCYPDLKLKENSSFIRNDLMVDERVQVNWNL